MRLFIASSFEPGFSDNLKAISDFARATAEGGAVKWVEPENFHLTYAFLGDMDQQGAAAAARGMEAGLDGVKAFKISSGSFGVFPPSRRPSVLWVGIAGGAAGLREVAEKLAEGLAAEGLIYENKFEPHVTIGRVKRPLPANCIARVAEYTSANSAVSTLSSVELMESVLTPSGSVYKQVYSKRLSAL